MFNYQEKYNKNSFILDNNNHYNLMLNQLNSNVT